MPLTEGNVTHLHDSVRHAVVVDVQSHALTLSGVQHYGKVAVLPVRQQCLGVFTHALQVSVNPQTRPELPDCIRVPGEVLVQDSAKKSRV